MHMADEKTFIERVRTLMGQRGLNQKRLAKMAGVGETPLSGYLKGTREPRMDARRKIARALGVTIDELLTPRPAAKEKPQVNLSKEVWIPVRGKVWATPFRISAGQPLGYVKGKPGEDSLFALVVEGESMLPIYKPGSVIVCRPEVVTLQAFSADDESAYVPYEMMQRFHTKDAIVTHNSETMLKRISVERTQGPKYDLYMVSLNEKYPKVKLHIGDDWMLQAIVKRLEDEPEYLT